MKDLSRKQVIVPMNIVNSNRFIILSNKHISNINRDLKNIKLDIMADFIQADHRRLVITINKAAFTLDFNTINSNNIMSLRLSQSKFYLKILDILYLIEDTNISISSDVVEIILQYTHIFNNIVLTLKPKVIKVSSKLDMAVIWIDIWNAQSSSKAKSLINRYLNVRNLIATI